LGDQVPHLGLGPGLKTCKREPIGQEQAPLSQWVLKSWRVLADYS